MRAIISMLRIVVRLQIIPVKGVTGSLVPDINKHCVFIIISSYFPLLSYALCLKGGTFCRSKWYPYETKAIQNAKYFFYYA